VEVLLVHVLSKNHRAGVSGEAGFTGLFYAQTGEADGGLSMPGTILVAAWSFVAF
jgi:hypothetical protein